MSDINRHYQRQVFDVIKRLKKIECEYGEIFVENEDCLDMQSLDRVEDLLITAIETRKYFEYYLTELKKAERAK